MAYNYEYPYTDPNRFNVDWLLNAMKNLTIEMKEFVNLNSIKWHDPLQWDITTQYERLEIVKNDGKAYLSKQPVPLGIAISNVDYWQEIGDFDIDSDTIRENIAPSNEHNEVVATEEHLEDSLLWWSEDLWVALSDISVGTALAPNINVKRTTCEEYFKGKINEIWNLFTTELVLNDLTVNGDTTLEDTHINGDTTLEDTHINGDLYYGETNDVSDYFKWIKAYDKDGNEIHLLTQTELTEELTYFGGDFTTPEKFGAVADGVTDDHDAFQLCINDAHTNHKIIVLAGKYYIGSTLLLKDNLRVIGMPSCSIIDAIDQPTPDYTYPYTGGFLPLFEGTEVNNILIEGVNFEGNTTTQSAMNWVTLFDFYKSSNIFITKCLFDKPKASDSILFTKCNNVHVEQCRFNYYKYFGVGFIESRYCYVDNSVFTDVGLDYANTYAIAITQNTPFSDDKQCSFVYVRNNSFQYPNTTANWETIDAHGGEYIIIDGNIITDCKDGIAILSSLDLNYTSRNVTISNNKVQCKGNHPENREACCVAGGVYFSIHDNLFINGGCVSNANPVKVQCCALNLNNTFRYGSIHHNHFAGSYCHDISITMENGQTLQRSYINDNYFEGVTALGGTSSTLGVTSASVVHSLIFDSNIYAQTSGSLIFEAPSAGNDIFFKDNDYHYVKPTWSALNTICPDCIDNPATLNYGVKGAICKVNTPTSGQKFLYYYNGSSWIS